MKKLFLLLFVLLLASSFAYAAFTPTLLKIQAPNTVHYDFDGSTLNLPVYVDGRPATVIMTVFTKDKGGEVVDIQNGNLGWHYMNRIDTCVFVSPRYTFGTGDNTITWNGECSDGGTVSSGTYTYYLWGFDHITPRELAVRALPYNWKCSARVITHDEDGTARTQPLIVDVPDDDTIYTELQTRRYMRWNLGDAPEDTGLVTGTFITSFNSTLSLALDPTNYDNFYHEDIESSSGNSYFSVRKYSFVPGASAEWDQSWGGTGNGTLTWTLNGGDYDIGGPFTLDETTIISAVGCGDQTCMISQLIYIDRETGDELRRMDLDSRFVFQRPSDGAWRNRTPCDWSYVNGVLSATPHYCTVLAGIDPYATTQEDFWLWHNRDGDGFHDYYSESANFGGIYQYVYGGRQDSNNFLTTPAYDLGSVTFDCTSPDGTGLGYFSVANEIAGMKSNTIPVDYGSAYDGLYVNNPDGSVTGGATGWWFIGQDSFKGTITAEVSVEETAPSAYTVAQNTPNPFNPTTTISFNLAKAGKTTVDIYNVAGQKVDTLVNGSMSAGNHSVVWNAAKFSAGVYFYTVKSGSFSKTMKMTLVK